MISRNDSGKQQHAMASEAQQSVASMAELFSEMVKSGLTGKELETLISRRPTVWGQFSSWVSKLPCGGV